MTESKPLRLVWGTPAVPGGRWFFALVNLRLIPESKGRPNSAPDRAQMEAYSRHLVHISLRGVGLWLLLTALLAYLVGAAFVLQRLKTTHPRLQATYLDVALPQRWDELSRLRGTALIDHARELLADQKTGEGFALLRHGLSRHPSDFSARLDIALAYAAGNMQPKAIKLLGDGVSFGYPGRAYLETLVALLTESDQPDLKHDLLSLAREKALPVPEARRDLAWLDEQLARALAEAGRDAEAIEHVRKNLPADDPAARRFITARLLTMNRAPEAADIARDWAKDFPREAEPLCILADSLRASGDIAGMDAALERLERLDPARPDGLLYSVIQNHQAGRPAEAERKLEQLIFRHGSTPAFYTVVCASFLGFRHQAGLARMETEMRERGFSPRPALWARVRLAEQARDWPELLRVLEKFHATPGTRINPSDMDYLEAVERLAHACIDGSSGTQSSLVESVRARPPSLVFFRSLIEHLLQASRPATAKEIYGLAEGPYPDSRSLRELRSKIEVALASVDGPLPAARSNAHFADWESFAAAVHARVEARDAEGAFALFAGLRRAQPVWLQETELRVDALELPLRARSDDPLRLQVLLRAALLRDSSAPDALLLLAQVVHAEGLVDNARFIVREILRHAPEHEAAQAQLKQWEPPPSLGPRHEP
jgi:hypothetical protein